MRAKIRQDGVLVVWPESETEAYALNTYMKDSFIVSTSMVLNGVPVETQMLPGSRIFLHPTPNSNYEGPPTQA